MTANNITRRAALCFLLATFPISAPVHATTPKDMQVAARAVGFVEPSLGKAVTAAIVYDPANPASKADADSMLAALGNGISIKGGVLKGKLIAVSELGALPDHKVAFIADGLASHHAAIFKVASVAGVLTVSADSACVNSSHCVVGVESEPNTIIVVNTDAQNASNIKFAGVFMVMVKKQ